MSLLDLFWGERTAKCGGSEGKTTTLHLVVHTFLTTQRIHYFESTIETTKLQIFWRGDRPRCRHKS